MTYLFFLNQSPSFSLCTVFDSISSNIDEVLSINLFNNAFIFGDFNAHHKDWTTYSDGTDRSGELCYNFSFSNDLTQMVNFPTHIPDYDSHSPALLDIFLSSDISICSAITFLPLGNSDHVVVSVSFDFSSNSQRDALFHCIAYDYSFAYWDSLCNHLRDVPWGRVSLRLVLLLLLVNFVRGFRLQMMYISLTVIIRSSLTHLPDFQRLAQLP